MKKKKNKLNSPLKKNMFDKIFDSLILSVITIFISLFFVGIFSELITTLTDIFSYLKGGKEYDKSIVIGAFGLGFTFSTMLALMITVADRKEEKEELKLYFTNSFLIMSLSLIFFIMPHKTIYNDFGGILYYFVISIILLYILIKIILITGRLVIYLLIRSRFPKTLPSLLNIDVN